MAKLGKTLGTVTTFVLLAVGIAVAYSILKRSGITADASQLVGDLYAGGASGSVGGAGKGIAGPTASVIGNSPAVAVAAAPAGGDIAASSPSTRPFSTLPLVPGTRTTEGREPSAPGRTVLATLQGTPTVERPAAGETFANVPTNANVVLVGKTPISLANGLSAEEFAARLAP